MNMAECYRGRGLPLAGTVLVKRTLLRGEEEIAREAGRRRRRRRGGTMGRDRTVRWERVRRECGEIVERVWRRGKERGEGV